MISHVMSMDLGWYVKIFFVKHFNIPKLLLEFFRVVETNLTSHDPVFLHLALHKYVDMRVQVHVRGLGQHPILLRV